MGTRGARLVAIIIWVVYPVLSGLLFMISLSHMPADALSQTSSAANAVDFQGLSEFEYYNGIGPVTKKLSLGEINPELVSQGKEAFKIKCTACHKLNERYVGPPLRGVTTFRSPEYIMNMMLNPAEMTQKHPMAKALFVQYLTQMNPTGLTHEDARAILEYLRHDFEQNM